MAYTIEYSAYHYQRLSRIRQAVLLSLAALAAVAAAIYLRVEEISRRPTYAEIVRDGLPARPGHRPAVPALQASADRAFATGDSWDALAATHVALAPYFRLRNVPAPVRRIATTALAAMGRGDVKPLLVPQSFQVAYADNPRDWTGARADRPRRIVAEAAWRTRRDYLPEEGAAIRAAATNLFGAALSGDSAPEVLSFDFAGQGLAGEAVAVKFSFPSAARLPVSHELGEVVRRLAGLHDELERLDVGAGADELGVVPLKLMLGARLKAEDAAYRRSLNPGAWIAGRFPPGGGCYGSESNVAARILERWQGVADARLPWRRARIRRVVNGRNFVSPRGLAAFLDTRPSPAELDACRLALERGCAPLTNAIDAVYFEAFDPAPAARETLHPTENLFLNARGTGLFPTNRIAAKALAEGETLVVSFPTRYHADGIRFDDEPFQDAGRYQFVFAPWRYDYVATNAPVEAADVSKGLAAFLDAGYGYEPDAFALDFHLDKVVGIHFGGLLPVKQERASLKAGDW